MIKRLVGIGVAIVVIFLLFNRQRLNARPFEGAWPWTKGVSADSLLHLFEIDWGTRPEAMVVCSDKRLALVFNPLPSDLGFSRAEDTGEAIGSDYARRRIASAVATYVFQLGYPSPDTISVRLIGKKGKGMSTEQWQFTRVVPRQATADSLIFTRGNDDDILPMHRDLCGREVAKVR